MIKAENKQITFDEFTKLIDPNTEIVVTAPWNGKLVPVTIRMLDSVTLNMCGDFNTIAHLYEEVQKEKAKFDSKAVIETKNIHENILKHCLVHPTFKELEEHLMQKDFYKNVKDKIEETQKLINSLTKVSEKQYFQEQLDNLELSIAFLLPEDFTGFIVSVIMQREATDIHKLTRETLLRAGFLAEKYNVRPSEYIEGTFTEKQKMDIDISALSFVAEYREMQKTEKNGMRWIRGKKGKP